MNLIQLRKVQIFSSTLLFFIVFIICHYTTGFRLVDIQLSYWGVLKKVSWMWNGLLIILGMSSFFNIYHYIKQHTSFNFKMIFALIFLFECMNISMMGIITMNYNIHNIIAYIYFFTLPLSIFTLGLFNIKRMLYEEWIVHIITSAIMMIIPLFLYFYYPGMAIAESVHSGIFILWNLFILDERK